MKKRAIAISMALLLVLTSCGGTSKQDKILADYDQFWSVLEERYPLYAAAGRMTGNDYRAVKEEYRAVAARAEDVNGLVDALLGCVKAFDGAGHLALFTSQEEYAKMATLYGQLSKVNEKAAYIYDRLNNPDSVKCYRFDPDEGLETIEESGGNQVGTESNGNLAFETYPEQKAAYVSIRAMANDWDNNDSEVLRDWFAEIEGQDYKHCIVDIRGNGGGNDSYWKSNIVARNLSKVLTMTSYGLIKGDECGRYIEEFVGKEVHPLETLPLEALPALEPGDLEGMTSYWKEEGSAPPKGEPLFSGQFWLLVDEKVYSSSESMAVFCKSTGFATLVGTPTGGDTPGGDPLPFVLSNSGLVFRFSPGNTLNSDGSCNEEFGTAPDILIEPGQDALKICLEMIDKSR